MRAKPEQHSQDPLPIGRILQRRQRLAPQPHRQLRQLLLRDRGHPAEARRIVHLPDQLQRLALAGHHNARRHAIPPQQTMIHLAPLNAVPALAFQPADPLADLVEAFRKRSRIRSAQAQFQRKKALALDARAQQPPVIPLTLHLAAQIVGRGPIRGAHFARAARSARYSSMVRLRSIEIRPFSLCTNPTPAMYGSMMWIFCSGVTMSNCRFSRAKSSRP